MISFNSKDEARLAAEKNTINMSNEYSKEIYNSVSGTDIFSGGFKHESGRKEPFSGKTSVQAVDSVTGARQPVDRWHYRRICILNFASYKNAGGRFLDGSMAQEEALCHESFLYNVLKEFQDTYYTDNCKHLNKGLYLDRALYTPGVVFKSPELKSTFDVLTCASPNWSAAGMYGRVSPEENSTALESRIKFLLDVAQFKNVDCLILGAFGCGVFKQDAVEVANIFKRNLVGRFFKEIVFAIPNEFCYNHTSFKEVFKEC